jgi:hypothetical protein
MQEQRLASIHTLGRSREPPVSKTYQDEQRAGFRLVWLLRHRPKRFPSRLWVDIYVREQQPCPEDEDDEYENDGLLCALRRRTGFRLR